MKKSKKILSLNKLVISKLNNPLSIIGGTREIIIDDGGIAATRHTKNPDICPTGTATCPETLYFSCKSCFPCNTQINTEQGC